MQGLNRTKPPGKIRVFLHQQFGGVAFQHDGVVALPGPIGKEPFVRPQPMLVVRQRANDLPASMARDPLFDDAAVRSTAPRQADIRRRAP